MRLRCKLKQLVAAACALSVVAVTHGQSSELASGSETLGAQCRTFWRTQLEAQEHLQRLGFADFTRIIGIRQSVGMTPDNLTDVPPDPQSLRGETTCLIANSLLGPVIAQLRLDIPVTRPFPERHWPSERCVQVAIALDAWPETNPNGFAAIVQLMERYELSPSDLANRNEYGLCEAIIQRVDGLQSVAINPPNPGLWKLLERYKSRPIVRADVSSFEPAFGGDAVSLWVWEETLLAWEVGPGAQRRAWIWQTDPYLASWGYERGTLVFEGRRDGDRVTGWFGKPGAGCGQYPFDVTLTALATGNTMIMEGTEPFLNGFCAFTGEDQVSYRIQYVAEQPADGRLPPIAEASDGIYAAQYRINAQTAPGGVALRAAANTSSLVVANVEPGRDRLTIVGEGCEPQIDADEFRRATPANRAGLLSQSWCKIDIGGIAGWMPGRHLQIMQ